MWEAVMRGDGVMCLRQFGVRPVHRQSREELRSAARRLGVPAGALVPLAIGRTTVAACRTAYDCWLAEPDSDLTSWLDEALGALGRGFVPGASSG